MKRLKKMPLDEFLTKILTGERDFSRVKLLKEKEHWEFIKDLIKQMNTYLKMDNLKKQPIILSYSKLDKVIMHELYFPYLKAEGLVVYRSHLSKGNFEYADFTRAKFYDCTHINYAQLKNARFTDSYHDTTRFEYSDLEYARFDKARLNYVDFMGANLKDIKPCHSSMKSCTFIDAKNLKTIDLDKVKLFRAEQNKITQKEMKILKRKDIDCGCFKVI